MTRNLRLLGVAWLLNVKQLTRSSFDGFLAIAWPIFFATVAFFMFEAGGNPESLIYAALEPESDSRSRCQSVRASWEMRRTVPT